MVDYKELLKGQMYFFIGFILIVIINFLIGGANDDGLITQLESATSSYNLTEIGQIVWFGVMLIYILAGVVMPLYYIYKGLTTDTGGNPFINIVVAVLTFLFNILITIKGWYMVTAVASIAPDAFVQGIFWIGFVIVWLSTVIVAPVYTIMKNTTER